MKQISRNAYIALKIIEHINAVGYQLPESIAPEIQQLLDNAADENYVYGDAYSAECEKYEKDWPLPFRIRKRLNDLAQPFGRDIDSLIRQVLEVDGSSYDKGILKLPKTN